MAITKRIEKLKKNSVSKACHNGGYIGDIKVDLERAKLWTESYKETEGKPEIIRRAKALSHMLSNMKIYIQDGELIVGNNTASPNILYLSPEISAQLMTEAMDDGYIKGDDVKIANEIMDYWDGKTLKQKVENELTDKEKTIIDSGSSVISITYKDGAQHCVPNWEHVYGLGFDKIIENIKAEQKIIDDKLYLFNGPGIDDVLKQKYFLEAMLITCNAVLNWCKRYSILADEMAKFEKNEQRKNELNKISKIFNQLLKKPPVSFQEALQCYFTLHIILNYIDRAGFGSLSRIDQIWWPYYKKDVIDEKNITRADAQELIESLWIKMLDLGYWFPRQRRKHFEGNSLLQTLTLAGVDENGNDACNELTSVILDATRSVRTNQPTLNFRYHPNVSQTALDSALEVIKTGMGMPAFLNDKVLIESLMDQNIPIKEARNWGVVGCVSGCPVNMQITTKRLAQSSIIAKCFELALNNGICVLTGKEIGIKTGDPSNFSYKDLVEAFRLQVEFAFRLGVKVRNITRKYEMEMLQRPLASALHKSPIKRLQDVSEYEDAPNLWINCIGIVDVVDSLMVIKKIVYEENKVSLVKFIDILKNNWEENEPLRQYCINKVPKFGNSLDDVDAIGVEIFRIVAEEARKVKDINGGTYRILPQSVSLYVSTGKKVAALPNGRKAFDFLCDGGISPSHGMDHNGPTAVLNSAAKIDHGITKGILLNQRFHPDVFADDEGKARFKSYIKSWYDLGLSQIQLNVVSTKDLIAAQATPDKYADLIVRVAGYSAYFTELNKDVQDAIINRMEQRLN